MRHNKNGNHIPRLVRCISVPDDYEKGWEIFVEQMDEICEQLKAEGYCSEQGYHNVS